MHGSTTHAAAADADADAQAASTSTTPTVLRRIARTSLALTR